MKPQPFLSAPATALSKRLSNWQKQRRYPDTYGLNGRNLLLLAAIVMAISFLSAFFLREWISGVAVSIAIVGATVLLGRKAYIDNSHVFITQPRWPKAAMAIALIYTPVALAIWSLASFGFWFDDKIEQGIQWTQSQITGHIEEHTREVEEEVTVRRSSWNPLRWESWNPVRWGYVHYKRKVLRTYKTNVLVPASIGVRLFYSMVYTLLRLLQYASFASLAYVFIRSCVFVVARSMLYAGGTVKFRLPHARELAMDTAWESPA
jgi:hypothetical protein